jgi:phosphomannomutase
MRKENAPFAGELSGHFYFREHYFSDCATLAMVVLLDVMDREKKPLSELVAPLRRYANTGELNFEVANPDQKLAEIRTKYADGEQDELDGISVVYPDYWFNVRKSNTEPLLRLMLEAKSKPLMEQKTRELEKVIGGKPH